MLGCNLQISKKWPFAGPNLAAVRYKKYGHLKTGVIAIGTGKCGTGSLEFIDCHPDVVFRNWEPIFYLYRLMVALQNLYISDFTFLLENYDVELYHVFVTGVGEFSTFYNCQTEFYNFDI